jgi:transcriptional regulator with XRE-family HTH domain
VTTKNNLVRDVRMKKGFTQAALAQKSGIAGATIARIDANASAKLHLAQALKIADALGCDLTDLVPA